MNIGMVVDNQFTGDMRIENEVTALRNAGINVFVLCFNYGNKPIYEDFHGAKIIRINLSEFWKKKMKGLTNTIFNFYPHYWANRIKKYIIEENIDILHLHDLYMLPAGLLAQKKISQSIKIVADLHENYVHALKHYKFANSFPGNFLISIPKWKKKEVEWCHKANHLITVIDEAVERYCSLGIPKEKITVVANYVNQSEFLNCEDNQEILNRYQDKFVITYIGGFDIHRGLEVVIKAVSEVVKHISSIKLVLVGQGRNMTDLQNLANRLNIANYISFDGWQPPAYLPSYIKASDVCLIPHLKTVHTDNTIPHKLFQYMLLEKPVVATNCNPIQRIVEETKCGLIYENKNSHHIADAVIKLYNNQSLRQQMGANGKKAVLEKYNWEKTSANLVNLYKELEKSL